MLMVKGPSSFEALFPLGYRACLVCCLKGHNVPNFFLPKLSSSIRAPKVRQIVAP
jgi:hypothetical protein